MTFVRLVARPLLAAIFVFQGAKAAKDPERLVPLAQNVTERVVPAAKRVLPKQVADRIPEDPRLLVRLNGGLQVAAGLALASSKAPRIGAWALVASLVPTTLAGHRFWELEDPETRGTQRVQLLKNLGLAGGLLLAAVDTDGRPGLAWRARTSLSRGKKASARAAKQARHEARHAAQTARANLG